MYIQRVSNFNERANQLSAREKDSGAQLIEIDSSRYFLSGHPAIRVIKVASGRLTDSGPIKMMTYESFVGYVHMHQLFFLVNEPNTIKY